MSKKSRYILIVLLPLLVQITCIAQIDSTFVRVYDRPFSIKGYFQYKSMEVEHKYGKVEDTFESNNPVGVGLGFTWKKVSISGSVSIPALREKNKGKTKSFDIQHHYYGQKFVSDLFIQDYKGFYKKEKNSDKVLAICPDIHIARYGWTGHYIFNNKKFSYSAAFNNNSRQLVSAGSFLLGGNIFYTNIRSDSSFVYKDDYKQKNLQVGISGGYAYTWALKRYYINLSLAVGLNLGTDNISEFYKHKIDVYPSFLPRLAAGYYGKEWTVGVSGVFHTSNVFRNGDDTLNLSSGSIQLTVTRRLDFKSKLLDKITFQ